MLILIVSFGGVFENEDDDENDSIPVNFQTGSSRGFVKKRLFNLQVNENALFEHEQTPLHLRKSVQSADKLTAKFKFTAEKPLAGAVGKMRERRRRPRPALSRDGIRRRSN